MRDRSAPGWIISIVGEDNSEEAVTDQSHRVLSLSYTDAERKADKLSLDVENEDLSNFDDQLWKQGHKIRVSWGYPGRMAPTREVVIESVKGFRKLRVEAKALSVLMNRVNRRRVFENMTRSQVAAQIAADNGWAEDQQDVEDSEVVHPVITQANLTDAQFIRRLAHQEGFEFYVDFDGFHFHERRLGQRPSRTLTYFTDPGAGDLIRVHVTNDITARPGRVRATGRDPLNRTTVTEEADNQSDQDREVLGPILAVNRLEGTAGAVLTGKKAEGFRRDLAREAGGRDGSQETQPTTEAGALNSSAAARRRARSRFRRAQRVAVEMTAEAIGDPSLLAKSVVQLEGLGQRLSGLYYIKEATHKLGQNGYTMGLTLLADGHRGFRRRRRRDNSGLPEVTREAAQGQVNKKETSDTSLTGILGGLTEALTGLIPEQTSRVTGTDANGAQTTEARQRYRDRRGRDSRTGGGGRGTGGLGQ